MRVKNKWKRISALALGAVLTLGMLPVTSMPVHAATTAKCYTFAELQNAIADETVDEIVIENDLEITETLEVNRDVTIRGEKESIPKLTGNISSNTPSIFKTYADVTFENLTIDGNDAMSCAITVFSKTCVLNSGVTIQNCIEYGLMTVGTTVMNDGVKIKNNNIGVCVDGIGETTYIMNSGTLCENN